MLHLSTANLQNAIVAQVLRNKLTTQYMQKQIEAHPFTSWDNLTNLIVQEILTEIVSEFAKSRDFGEQRIRGEVTLKEMAKMHSSTVFYKVDQAITHWKEQSKNAFSLIDRIYFLFTSLYAAIMKQN